MSVAPVRIVNGYRMIYKPDHSDAIKSGAMRGYVYEHRLIAEGFMGRSLAPTENVHHLDENRLNNLPNNLLVLENTQHAKLHAFNNRYIHIPKPGAVLEKIGALKYCRICGTQISSNATYCSRQCASVDSRLIPDMSADQLHELVWDKPTTHVAAELGVSDTAVAKLCKRLGVEKPPRGYWAKVAYNKI